MTFRDDNGNELEFGGEFAMTKQSVSFFNGAIKGDVSINFTVENNSVNRKVLNYYGPQMTSQVAFTKQAFNRIRNGNILDRGYIVIQDEDGDKLNCFYVSGNSNWVQILNGLITDINWPTTISSTGLFKFYKRMLVSDHFETDTDGVIFPHVDWAYGFKKGSNKFISGCIADTSQNYLDRSFTDYYPSVYIYSVIREALNTSGLKISGTLLTDQLFRSLVMTPFSGQMTRDKIKEVNAVGSLQSIPTGVDTKYTSFTEISDEDNLFSDNSYTCKTYSSVLFRVTNVTSTTDTGDIRIYKNGTFLTSLGVPPSGSVIYNTGIQGVIFGVPGDILDIRIRQNTGVARNFTLNVSINIPRIIVSGDFVNPNNFLPKMKSIDLLRSMFTLFGCSVYYNEFSKTITATIIEGIKTEDALDWSQYYISHRSEYTVSQGKNNYIRYEKSKFSNEIISYDQTNELKFSDGNIQTGNTLKTDNELYQLPFTPFSGSLSKTNSIFQTSVPIVNLIDDLTPLTFTAKASGGANLTTYTLSVASSFIAGEVIRVTNSLGASLGYLVVYSTTTLSTSLSVLEDFVLTDTGIIYRQKIQYNEVGPGILSVKHNTNITDYSNSSYIGVSVLGAFSTKPTASLGVFSKPIISNAIDQWKSNLSIDNPNIETFTDPTIKQLYFNKISKFLQNPNIRCKMLLPESVYQSFVFDQFIYLKTEKLTGYFFVDSIVNYVDGNTPVEVNLYML